ncbi:hypothetical protein AAIR98_001463 [Elusimicrobium simillimum]|uniref:hypothetical protein n=1 Tax=Elusimicrobium simillimum TaxID=3143438 RepID=UPI003C6F5408
MAKDLIYEVCDRHDALECGQIVVWGKHYFNESEQKILRDVVINVRCAWYYNEYKNERSGALAAFDYFFNDLRKNSINNLGRITLQPGEEHYASKLLMLALARRAVEETVRLISETSTPSCLALITPKCQARAAQ